MKNLKLFVAGQKYFGALVLESVLKAGYQVAGVSAPANYDGKYDRLYNAAKAARIPVAPAGSLCADTLPAGIDLLIAAHSYDFIGKRTRQKLRIGAIGYHPSLLPLHRGRDAIYWAIKMGERVTGGSVYWLNDNVDGGPIAGQELCFIRKGDTPAELWRRELQGLGVRLILKTLGDISAGTIVAIPQDESLATWEPSVERPPLFRPDLLSIGSGIEGFRYVTAKS